LFGLLEFFTESFSGKDGSISVNFSSRTNEFSLDDNFNIYDLDLSTGNSRIIREGIDDQPDLRYIQTDQTLKDILMSR